jgi:hypothetical protein
MAGLKIESQFLSRCGRVDHQAIMVPWVKFILTALKRVALKLFCFFWQCARINA